MAHSMLTFPTTETTLLLPGPVGVLESVITPQSTLSNRIAIVCHPNPTQGGTMNNKVVTMTCKALQHLGLTTIRFNYRGVGQSSGEFGNAVGETADLFAIMDWVKAQIDQPEFWLAGFSFGSYIAAQGAMQNAAEVQALLTIAPAVDRMDFQGFAAITCPWLVIQGTDDEVVPTSAVREWFAHFSHQRAMQLIEIPTAGHFFHGKLIELRDTIIKNF